MLWKSSGCGNLHRNLFQQLIFFLHSQSLLHLMAFSTRQSSALAREHVVERGTLNASAAFAKSFCFFSFTAATALLILFFFNY